MRSRDKGSIKGLLIFAAIFYIAVSLLAIGLLNLRGSVFSDRPLFPSFVSKSEEKSDLKTTLVTGSVETLDEEEPVSDVEFETEEAQTMIMDDSQDNITVQPGVLVDNSEGDEEEEEVKHYYSFTAINTTTILHMREEPDINSKSIYKLKPGTSGYVLELGDDWSLVTADTHVGYCSNEYLNMKEIPEDEYPEELR